MKSVRVTYTTIKRTKRSCFRTLLNAPCRYCVRTKGKLEEPDKPGASGKGQVYLEGAVDILRSVDTIDFHLLYSGRVRNPALNVTLLGQPT